jgi:hypothetical protein
MSAQDLDFAIAQLAERPAHLQRVMQKASWTRVGVAFAHKDGNGLNVELRAIPVSGKLVIRRHEAKLKSNAS